MKKIIIKRAGKVLIEMTTQEWVNSCSDDEFAALDTGQITLEESVAGYNQLNSNRSNERTAEIEYCSNSGDPGNACDCCPEPAPKWTAPKLPEAGQVILIRDGRTIAVEDVREEDDGLIHTLDMFETIYTFRAGFKFKVLKQD